VYQWFDNVFQDDGFVRENINLSRTKITSNLDGNRRLIDGHNVACFKDKVGTMNIGHYFDLCNLNSRGDIMHVLNIVNSKYERFRNDPTPALFPPRGVMYIRMANQLCLHCGKQHASIEDPLVCDGCRSTILDAELAKVGLKRRNDSKLCFRFIQGRLPMDQDLYTVVDMCMEMNWLFEHTPYAEELDKAIKELKEVRGDISGVEAHGLCDPIVRAEILKKHPRPERDERT
jgi:hypothetical protein